MREPRRLTAEMVRALHSQLLAEHGGLPGMRDRGLLESALAAPRHRFAYRRTTLAREAAAHGFGLCRDRPFVDGNRRVSLAAMDVFLQLQGKELAAPEEEAVEVILALAEGELREAALAGWIARHMRRLKARRGPGRSR